MQPPRRLKISSIAALAALFAFAASAEEPRTTAGDAGTAPVFDPTVGFPPRAERSQPEASAGPQAPVNRQAAGAEDEQPGSADVSVPDGDAAPAVDHADQDGSTGIGNESQPLAASTETGAGQADVPAPAVQGIRASDFSMPDDIDGLEPYKLIRSLQVVQDSVVRGDHSAMAMQRFLLEVIDGRLRSADERVFDDPRNVDAALIYAMSGGNPDTLDILALKDKFGNFDNEITTVLRAYLKGRAVKTQTELVEVVQIYRDTAVGPYLTLVAANVTAALNDTSALELFDWARLSAPGTLVEEAALRRSLFIAARNDLVDEAIHYAQLYARRFIQSPYAGQYADLLVDLVVLNYGKVGEERLDAILSFMDRPRKREVYLRIARKAVISGLRDLALLASARAEELLAPGEELPKALSDLYAGMAKVPTDGVDAVLETLNMLSETQLSRRDRALREAARLVASEVVRKPDLDSLTQAISPIVDKPKAEAGTTDLQPEASGEGAAETADLAQVDEETEAAVRAFDGYVSDRKQTLERIDRMLESVGEDQGS